MSGQSRVLLDRREILTPADHRTHRRYQFEVPPDTRELAIAVRYTPKRLGAPESRALTEAALGQQTAALTSRVGVALAEQWSADQTAATRDLRIANLLTISLDDADGVYRGAAHRHDPDQHLVLGPGAASPGLVVGGLPGGVWQLTLSAHTLASDQCEVSIQIAAEIASRH